MIDKNSIGRLTSAVIDTGRRGEPLPGCDCMRCFGHCMVDRDAAVRERALANDVRADGVRRVELDFAATEDR